MNNAIEGLGYLLAIAFLWFVWPPLVLLGAGVLLIVAANVRAARSTGRTAGALAAAWAAARRSYQSATAAGEPAELRRIA